MSRPLTIKMVENDVPPHRLVILAAEGQATFCVCKVVLATRSPVFGSMLNLPHAAFEARGMVGAEDIPIIAVDERAKYMEPFLRAISDSNYFRPPQMHFYDVLAILKLSNKYQTWDLSRIALRHLETIYAVDLSQVHRRPQHSPTLGYYPQSLQYHFKAIQILEGVGAKWLLPAAYYAAASTFHTEIWRRDSSGSTYPPWAAIWETCVELVPFLESSTHRNYNTLLERSLCAFPSQCDQMKFRFLMDCDTTQSGPLTPLITPEQRWRWLLEDICDRCAASARARCDAIRSEVWEELPQRCHLGDWHTLLETRSFIL